MNTRIAASSSALVLVALVGASVAALAAPGLSAAVASAVVAAAACIVMAVGWLHLLSVPAKKSQAAAVGGSGLVSIAGALAAPSDSAMMWMPAAVALGLGAVFLIQLLRGTGQSHRLESVLGTAAGVAIAASASGWVALHRLPSAAEGPGLVIAAVISIAAAVGIGLTSLPDRFAAPTAVTAGAVLGMLVAVFLSTVAGLPAAAFPATVVGAVSGAVVSAARRLVRESGAPVNAAAAAAVGLAPVLAMGALFYFLAKLLAS